MLYLYINHQIQPTLSIIQNYPSAINDNQRSNRFNFYTLFNEDVNVIFLHCLTRMST